MGSASRARSGNRPGRDSRSRDPPTSRGVRPTLRAAIICPAYPPSEEEGGVSHFTQILARHVAAQGDTVTVVTDERYRGTGQDDAIDVVRLAGPWGGGTWK